MTSIVWSPSVLISLPCGLVTKSCPTVCNPMDLPGSSVHGILQARILEWVAMSFSRESPWPRDQTQVSCTAGGFFTNRATREGLKKFLNVSENVPQRALWFLVFLKPPVCVPIDLSFCLSAIDLEMCRSSPAVGNTRDRWPQVLCSESTTTVSCQNHTSIVCQFSLNSNCHVSPWNMTNCVQLERKKIMWIHFLF